MDNTMFQLWVDTFAASGMQLSRYTEVRNGVEVELYMLYGGGKAAFEFSGTDEDVEGFLQAVLDMQAAMDEVNELLKRARRQ